MEKSTGMVTLKDICNRVYVIRGQQVMLDHDLAEIYGYDVKALNQQVKRNYARFPEDFMFQLTREEIPEECLKPQMTNVNESADDVLEEDSKSQIVTLNKSGNKRGYNVKKLPYGFTEQEIYMLATVLRGLQREEV